MTEIEQIKQFCTENRRRIIELEKIAGVDNLLVKKESREVKSETDAYNIEDLYAPDTLAYKLLTSDKYRLEVALKLAHGNRAQAALLLGSTERTVYRKIMKYKL